MSQLNFLFFSTLMAILIWVSSPSVKAFPLANYEARYTVNWYGMYAGESIHQLSQGKDGQFHFEARTEPRLRFLPYHYVESSDFTWQSDKILPQKYSYNIREGNRHKQGNVIFDWDHSTAKNRALPRQEMILTDGTQDKITQTLSLRQALKSGQSKLTYQVVEADKIKHYQFIIHGEERLLTKLGVLDTVRIEHVSRKGHRTMTWFAKAYDFLPVKMVQSRQGKIVASGEILSYSQRT